MVRRVRPLYGRSFWRILNFILRLSRHNLQANPTFTNQTQPKRSQAQTQAAQVQVEIQVQAQAQAQAQAQVQIQAQAQPTQLAPAQAQPHLAQDQAQQAEQAPAQNQAQQQVPAQLPQRRAAFPVLVRHGDLHPFAEEDRLTLDLQDKASLREKQARPEVIDRMAEFWNFVSWLGKC